MLGAGARAPRRTPGTAARVGLAPLIAAAVLLAFGELLSRLAGRRGMGEAAGDGRTVVVVLGFRNASRTINGVNRWRVRSGILTARRYGADLVVFSGGSPGGHVEADLMAGYARSRGFDGDIATERHSRTTVENLELSAPFLSDATRIVLVSNPLHAERARRELRRTRPELARLLAPAVDDRHGAWLPGVPLGNLFEMIIRML